MFRAIGDFVNRWYSYVLVVLLMILTIRFANTGSAALGHSLDKAIIKDILTIYAFGFLGMLALHPIILFQLLVFRVARDILTIKSLFLSFYMAIGGNLVLLTLTIVQMAQLNITTSRDLVFHTIFLGGAFITINIITFIVRIELIKNHLVNKLET